MEPQKALNQFEKMIPKINKLDELDKELFATLGQLLLTRRKMEDRDKKNAEKVKEEPQ